MADLVIHAVYGVELGEDDKSRFDRIRKQLLGGSYAGSSEEQVAMAIAQEHVRWLAEFRSRCGLTADALLRYTGSKSQRPKGGCDTGPGLWLVGWDFRKLLFRHSVPRTAVNHCRWFTWVTLE